MNSSPHLIENILSSSGLIEAVNLFSNAHNINVVVYSMEDSKANIIYKTEKCFNGIPVYLLYKENLHTSHVSFLFDLALR